MTKEEIERGILHHWLTSIIEDVKKRDCSISALVLLNDQDHREITSTVVTIRNSDPIKAQHDGICFEYIFSRVLEDLLNNRYPRDWDQRYRQEWEQENKDGKNTMGITYLLMNLNNFYSSL